MNALVRADRSMRYRKGCINGYVVDGSSLDDKKVVIICLEKFGVNEKIFTRAEVQVAIVVVLGFFIRFLLTSSPVADEDEFHAYAPAALAYLKGDWTANNFHPMLVKLLFVSSVTLFGEHGKIGTLFPWLPESIGAVRLVSVVLGTATCLVVYLIVREITRRHLFAMIPYILLAFDSLSIGESSYGILDRTVPI